jgi:hypothetical protein
MMKRQIGLMLATLGLMVVFGSAAWAHPPNGIGMDTPNPNLPPPGVYLTPDQVHATYTGQDLKIVLQAIQHQPFGPGQTTHGPDGERHLFGSGLHGEMTCTGSACPFPGAPVQMEGNVQTIALGKGPTDTTGIFETEMLSMNLQGVGPTPPFVMIRESPTLPSKGRTSIEAQGGGMYHIDSFFDVFTELSLDGGMTWLKKAGPNGSRVFLNGVPEPGSIVLLALGLLGVGGLTRRR